MMRRTILVACALCAGVVLVAGAKNPEPFRAGERIAFLGDSITHASKYMWYLQLWENLRHPGSGVRMMCAGLNGDTAGGALGRLSYDVETMKPDRVFCLFGMNDVNRGLYVTKDADEATAKKRTAALDAYAKNLATLADRLAAMKTDVVLMTPSPYNQYQAKPEGNLAACNDPGLMSCAEIVRKTAAAKGTALVDLNRSLTDLFRRQRDFTFCPDRVHPGDEGHLAMAALVLQATGASPFVGETTVSGDERGAAFDYAPKALPFPAMPEYDTLRKLGAQPSMADFNYEIVRVTGLVPGDTYALRFDGREVGSFRGEEFAAGVNVAELDTPNRRLAGTAVAPMRELVKLTVRLRSYEQLAAWVRSEKKDPDDPAQADAFFEAFFRKQANSPYVGAFRVWHRDYLSVRAERPQLLKREEKLRGQIAALRPAASRVEVVRTAVARYEDGVMWRASQPLNIRIKAGSALDLSANGAQGPATKRIVIGEDGHFAFADGPSRPVKLFGYVMCWENIKWLIRDGKGGRRADWRANLDAYAEQVRRHGYNFVRPHGMYDAMELDNWMRTGVFTEERLEDLDYLAAALKKQGVYLYLDIAAYGLRWGEKIPGNIEMKSRVMNGDPEAVAKWQACAKAILERVNVFTGIAYKDDPAVVCIMQYNEQATGAKIAKGAALDAETHRALSDRFVATAKMYNDFTAGLGYQGLNSNYNSDVDLGATAARWMQSEVVSYNYHFGHPVKFADPGAARRGSRIDQNDSVSMSTRGFDFACGVRLRFPDRPYVCSEYSQAYWNARRYQAGALLPAYAALNGYDGILWHCDNVELENTSPYPRGRDEVFQVYSSPVSRADAFVASCLFLRGDVREAPHSAFAEYRGDLWKRYSSFAANTTQAKLGYLLKTGVMMPDLERPAGVKGNVRADVTFAPAKGDGVKDGLWVSTVAGSDAEKFDYDGFVAELKRKGIVPASNRTSDKDRFYESETGEIVMDGKDLWLTVTTPRTVAAALGEKRDFSLGPVSFASTKRALVALTSIDGKELGKSRRMVFVYATREWNNATKTSGDERTIVDFGRGPVILETGRVTARIQMDRPEGLRLYLLDYDGTRKEEIPVQCEKDALAFDLDTARTVSSPTPFFEIAEGPALPPEVPHGCLGKDARVILIGDSLTEQGVVTPRGYYHQLVDAAAKTVPGQKYEFVGLGFSGSHVEDWENWEAQSRTKDIRTRAHVKPGWSVTDEIAKGGDVLVFFLGQNDITRPIVGDDDRSIAAWIARYREMIARFKARARAKTVVLGTITACGTDPDSARNRGRRKINAALAALAAKEGWVLADFGSEIDALQRRTQRGWMYNLVGDFVHPDFRKLGHTALAKTLSAALGEKRMTEFLSARLARELEEHDYQDKPALFASVVEGPSRDPDLGEYVWKIAWRWTDSNRTEADRRRQTWIEISPPEGWTLVSTSDRHKNVGECVVKGRPDRLVQNVRLVAKYEKSTDVYDVRINAPWRVVGGLESPPDELDRTLAAGNGFDSPVVCGDKTVPWSAFQSSIDYCGFWHPGNVNPEQFTFGTKTDTVYAMRVLKSARRRTVSAKLSHDTWSTSLAFRVFLNGKEIFKGQMGGGTKELPVPPFELNPGDNLLVIRCDHHEWQRQFAFDLVPEKGDDLSDLRIGWRATAAKRNTPTR